MNRIGRFSLAFFLLMVLVGKPGLSLGETASAPEASYTFKNNMHRIFHAYNHTRISLGMERYDISLIQLDDALAAIEELPELMPARNSDGGPFFWKEFLKRLPVLHSKMTALKEAIQAKNKEQMERLPGEIFNLCIQCHSNARLDYLFRLPPGRQILFQDYMHRLSETFMAIQVYEGSAEGVEKERQQLALAGYYLDLLQTTLPGAGPSGIILDPLKSQKQLAGLRSLTVSMEAELDQGKRLDAERLRQGINGFCVACHGPERLP
ncbi:MAG: hypothetical protein HQL52_04535 [Magnetococcales bacterium]|nr:hypothetical protein [Magnetococcales bacterium]